jgi:hypothetical protein
LTTFFGLAHRSRERPIVADDRRLVVLLEGRRAGVVTMNTQVDSY